MTLDDLISYIKTNRNKGRGEAFAWTDDELITYIYWADTFNYLFVESDESGFTGVAVMYPVAKKEEQDVNDLITFKNIIPVSDEKTADLCLMDIIASSPAAMKSLASQLKKRYPNWSNQNKWGLRLERPFSGFHIAKKLSNKYINLLTT